MRVLSRVHIAVIVLMGATLLLAAALLTTRLSHAEDDRDRRAALSRAVLVARADLRAAEETTWRARANGVAPRYAPRPDPEALRARITTLAVRSAVMEPASARVARDAATLAGASVDQMARVSGGTADSLPSHPADAALARWAATLRDAENSAADTDLSAITRSFTATLMALTALVGLVGVTGWVIAGRARRRMTHEFRLALSEQHSLYRTAETVAGETDVTQVLDSVAAEAARLLGAERAVVVRFATEETGEVAGSSGDAAMWDGPVPLTGDGVVARVHRSGAPAVEGDYSAVDDDTCRRMVAVGALSAVGAPIGMDGRRWGALVCFSPHRHGFDTASLGLLERYGRLAGLALANAAHRERLAGQASTDPLTGLPNHRAFRERLAAEVARAVRHETELALVIVDLDHFAQVNTALGHHGGDAVLADMAAVMRANARGSDMVARIGGQQFAVLMPECSSWGAWIATERLRATVARATLGGIDGQTLSAGLCDLRQAGGDPQRLVELASGALYWAKQHGRDLSVRYSPEVVVDLSAAERASRLERTRALDAVRLLAQAVDARDENTQRHSERVAAISREIARELGWSEERTRLLTEAALVHDVGKIGVPDSILLKDGPLTPEERVRVEGHAALGAQMITDVLGDDQVGWVRGHHERWDGRGYPDGLVADAIPDGARIMAVADSYDAMTSNRPYRTGMPPEMALAEVLRSRGSQFDPEAVDAFVRIAGSGRLAAARRAAGA